MSSASSEQSSTKQKNQIRGKQEKQTHDYDSDYSTFIGADKKSATNVNAKKYTDDDDVDDYGNYNNNNNNNNNKNSTKTHSLSASSSEEKRSSESKNQMNRQLNGAKKTSVAATAARKLESPLVKSVRRSRSLSTRSRSVSSRSSSVTRSPSRSVSRSRSRSRSRSSSSKSRSISRASSVGHINANTAKKANSDIGRKPKVNSSYVIESTRSSNKTDSKISKFSSGSYPAKLNRRPLNKPTTKQSSRSNGTTYTQQQQQRPPTDQLNRVAVRVMSAQRLKNNDLQNRIAEMSMAIEKLKEENRTLKRVHHREEAALKRLENQDNDVARLIRNHMEESNALKDIIKSVKNDNQRINKMLIDKDEEIRTLKKRHDDMKKIMSDKKLLDSAELSKKLEHTETLFKEYKTKSDNLEKRIEMMEKNHKHEIGVEMAHHKETQRMLKKINEENRELKVKLEEKERALDVANIYSRQTRTGGGESNTQPANWKSSTQSLNTVHESPRERARHDSEKKRKDGSKPRAGDDSNLDIGLKKQASPKRIDMNGDLELERQREDAERKKLEFELQLREQEAERKRKEIAAAEAAEKERLRALEREKLKKEKDLEREREREREREKEKQNQRPDEEERTRKINKEEEEKQRLEKQRLEEEDRKKRWISENTFKNVEINDQTDGGVDKSKKDELLAKLLLGSTTTTTTTTSTINTSNNQNLLNDSSATDSSAHSSKPPQKPLQNNNFTISINNSLPPKPYTSQKPSTGSDEVVDNLHNGLPTGMSPARRDSTKDATKNDLLSKLFGSNASDLNGKSKMNKVDDLFTSNNKSPPTSQNKIQTTTKPAKTSNNNVDHFDFFANLNSTNKPAPTNGLNRPKVETSKLIFTNPTIRQSNSATFEDIEELTL